MASKVFLVILLAVVSAVAIELQNHVESKILSRRKRFVVFPIGSSFSVAVCMTVGGCERKNYV